MSDSENESNSESLQHDLMSVSDQEEDGSRDGDDMPSVEIDNSEVREHQAPSREDDSIPTDSTSNEDLEQLPGEEVPSDKPEGKVPIRDLAGLDEAAVKIIYFSNNFYLEIEIYNDFISSWNWECQVHTLRSFLLHALKLNKYQRKKSNLLFKIWQLKVLS